MKIADLHCHPSFKTLLSSSHESERKDCWENVDIRIDFEMLDSQSSLTQLKNGRVKIAMVGLYGLERAFAAAKYIKILALLSPKLDKEFLKKVEGRRISYNKLMYQDYEHLMKSKDIDQNKKFTLLEKFSDFDETDGNMYLVLTLEGSHNFYGEHPKDTLDEEIIKNLRRFKQPDAPRIFYLTLTHLAQSVFCTHAYGMKLLKHGDFIPKGKGLTEKGAKVIEEALSDENNRRILIDIKHMSLLSRLQFYELMESKFPGVPIIASHMGITGCSYKNMPVMDCEIDSKHDELIVEYYPVKGIGDTTFNPWSINLYDEDIEKILLSGGIIGLTLDQRLLGFGMPDPEWFSAEEYPNARRTFPRQNIELTFESQTEDALYDTPGKRAALHLRHLCNNILHIVKIGRKIIGEQVWNRICIGSDYDGFIDPIDYCITAQHYPTLHQGLTDTLPNMAVKGGIPVADWSEKIDKIMYQNIRNFLQAHFA
jgi:microsomal dipeptidase-like Zn-dependent dipeptidase